MYCEKLSRISTLLIIVGLLLSLAGCEKPIDSRESANAAISEMVAKTVQPSTRDLI